MFTIPPAQEQCVYTNEHVQVYTPKEGRSKDHLVIFPNREISHFKEMNDDEVIAIHDIVVRATAILGGLSFQLSHHSDLTAVELIPVWPKFHDVKNLAHKMDLYRHIYFPLQSMTVLPSIATDAAFWGEKFAQPTPQFERKAVGPHEHWTIKTSHAQQATEMLQDQLSEVNECTPLQNPNWLVDAYEPQDVSLTEKGDCPFCKDTIINNQKIHENELACIMLNFRDQKIAATSFLILPNRHVQFTSELTNEEVVAMHQLECDLVEKLTDVHAGCRIVNYTQDGPASGQTVPHCHWQEVACWPTTMAQEHTETSLQDLSQGARAPMDKAKFQEQVTACREWFL